MKKNEVLKHVWMMAVVVMAVIFAVPDMDVSAKTSKKALTKKIVKEGQNYTISLKGISKKVKTKKLKWTTGNKQIVSIGKKSGNKAVLKDSNECQKLS